MAKKSITNQIIELAKEVSDAEQGLNALMSATNSLEPADARVILDNCKSIIDGLPAGKRIIWLARYDQAEKRNTKLMEAARNGQ